MADLKSRIADTLSPIGGTLAEGLFGKARSPKLDRPEGLAGSTGMGLEFYTPGQLSPEQLQRLAMQSAWFFSDIALLARKCSRPKLKVLQVTGEGTKEVYGHPFERLMRRPNPLMSGKFMTQYSMAWLGLDGNAYLYLTTNVLGELAELWPLPARAVKPVPGDGGVDGAVLSHYQWFTGGKAIKIPAEKICHFRLFPDPFNPLKGVGFIDALRYELRGDLAMSKWEFGFFSQKRAIPEAIASVPPETTDADIKRARREAEREFGGGQRRMMWVRAGQVKIEQLGLSQQQMQFLATREFKRETVDRVCGLPAGYWDKSATRANAEAAELALTRDTVAPILDGIAGEKDAQILDRYYEESLTAEYANVVPEDRRLAVQEFQAYSPVMTVDEAREQRNLEPLGGDLGGTPVALLPAVGQMMAGFGGMGAPMASAPASGESRAVLDELRTWQKVAMKEAAKGREPGEREFVCEWVPESVKGEVEEGLAQAVTVDEVRGVFGRWLDSGAAEREGYP